MVALTWFASLSRRHVWLTSVLIFAIAFTVRFTLLSRVPRGEILGGVGEARCIALAILHTHSFADPYGIPTGPTAHTTPFYPVLLAAITCVFGDGDQGALARCIVLISAYSLLYSLFPLLAVRFGMPASAGVIAGLLAALLPLKRSAEVFRGWEEPFAALTLAGLMLLALTVFHNRKFPLWLLLGAASGAALYVSASLASVVIAFAMLDLFSNWNRATICGWCLAAVSALLVISPWLIRNRLVLGQWVFMRDNLGLELRYSNHDAAAPSSELLNERYASYILHPFHSRVEAEAVRRLGEIAYNRRDMQIATHWISTHPEEFAVLSSKRFLYFWFGPPEHPFVFFVTMAYTVTGLFGLALIRRQCGLLTFRMWCTCLMVYPFIYYFVQYISRYRVAIDWLVWLSAGLVLATVWDRSIARMPSTKAAETNRCVGLTT